MKRRTKIRLWPMLIFIIFVFCLICMITEQSHVNKKNHDSRVILLGIQDISSNIFPIMGFVKDAGADYGFFEGIEQWILRRSPIYQYTSDFSQSNTSNIDTYTEAMILENEGKDEFFESEPESISLKEFELENSKAEKPVTSEVPPKVEFKERDTKSVVYTVEDIGEYKYLMENFYVVDATTQTSQKQLDGKRFLETDLSLDEDNEDYQILIYHTHSQEGFADSTVGDVQTGVIGAGKYLTKLLEEKYGLRVLHHEGEYDVQTRDYAYSYAAPAVEQILNEHPGIEVIIDLHRDGVADDRRLVTDLDGRTTAQIMFFNGLCYTKSTGKIESLPNPNLDTNLAFSFQMQLKANEYYPGLTRKIYLKGYRYNMHYRPKSLLVEMGAQTNTMEEIRNACEPFAHVLAMVLTGEEQ